MSEAVEKPRFWNYPTPKEGPDVPYQNDASPNPVLRGYPLAIAAWIIASSTFISGILWRNAKFDKLKDIKELDEYEPRHDPTVIPILPHSDAEAASINSLPAPKPRIDSNHHYTSADYISLYKSGKLTPSHVAEILIALISKDPNGEHSVAFLESRADLVREGAKASTKRYQEGKPLGPLDGVPVAVKDEVDLKGYKRTLGSKLDFTNKDDETAWCVKQWEEAGAIVIGKTNMHEIGLDTTNNNPHTSTPRNPHNPLYYPGGSSGGSAYAVATGLIPIALGADGGGSIRIPSSLCGIYGLKPSHGRISARPTHDLGSSVGVYGPIASSVDDLRLAYRVMAKPDRGQRGSSGMFPNPLLLNPSNGEGKPRKYLGIDPSWLTHTSTSPSTLSHLNRAISHYTTHKAYTLIHLPPFPLMPQAQKSHALTILTEVASHFSGSSSSSSSSSSNHQLKDLSYPSQLLLHTTLRHASAQQFLAAQKLRNLLMSHLAFLWERYPGMIVLSPTLPGVEGMRIQHEADVGASGGNRTWGVWDGDQSLWSMGFVFLANLLGCPALSMPGGYVGGDGDGGGASWGKEAGKIPIGIMGMGEWGSEEGLMDWAEDGVGILGAGEEGEGDVDLEMDGGDGRGGVRKPSGWEGAWVDVLGRAAQLNTDT